MNELQLLIAERTKLVSELAVWQKKLSEEKWGKRNDEKKAIRNIEQQIKALDKKIKEVQKFGYLNNGIEHGIDVRANQTNAIAGVIAETGKAVGSASAGMMGEFGLFGRGKVGIAEQNRLSKQGSGTSNPFTSMSSQTMLILGASLVVILMIFKKN